MTWASDQRERASGTSALRASSGRRASTPLGPWRAKARAAARPMRVNPPVINTTGLLMRVPHDVALPAGGAWMATPGSLISARGVSGARFGYATTGDHWRLRQRLCRLGDMLWRYGIRHGATASSLF